VKPIADIAVIARNRRNPNQFTAKGAKDAKENRDKKPSQRRKEI
jgi:hypothetical protein